MSKKRIPQPSQVRRVPKQFSWVDHRLVRLGYLRGRSPHALALYLFLNIVGDVDGVSWYGDERISVELSFSQQTVRQVRAELQKAGQSPMIGRIIKCLPFPMTRQRCRNLRMPLSPSPMGG